MEQPSLLVFQELGVAERIAHFKRCFPKSHLCIVNGHIEGLWITGNTYRGAYSSGYYGSYPHSYLERVLSLFPDCQDILHLFSGTVEAELTLDVKKEHRPVLCADAQSIPLRSGCIDLAVADPPYTKEDAEKYGTPWYSRIKVFTECWRILKPRGFAAWLDLLYPQLHFKKEYDFELYGLIAVVISTLHRPRLLTIIRKKPQDLFTFDAKPTAMCLILGAVSLSSPAEAQVRGKVIQECSFVAGLVGLAHN